MTHLIETRNLCRHYGQFTAVDQLSLHVRPGEIYGFLGLNGAGKTTTIRMLLGLITPSSGEILINGQKLRSGDRTLMQTIGSLVETPYVYPNLTVRENLELFRVLRGITDKKAVDSVMEQLRLDIYAGRMAKNLSLGNRQRLGLARALMHKPKLLILDEPTNGLDPAGIYEIRTLLEDLVAQHGVTLFVSSHILGEISKFASRIGIIHESRLIRELDSQELSVLFRKRLQLHTADNEKAFDLLGQNGYSFELNSEGRLESIDPALIEHPEKAAALLAAAGNPPALLQLEEEDLETYFLRTIQMKGAIA